MLVMRTTGKVGRIANAMCAGLERKNIINICELPSMAADNHKVIDYLIKSRGLPQELINELISRKLLYQDSLNNCVFPCYDHSGQFKGAILRGTLPGRGHSRADQEVVMLIMMATGS